MQGSGIVKRNDLNGRAILSLATNQKTMHMKEYKFRTLRSDEIEVRPTDTKFKGSATLLLYQNARTAMDILDETVGPFNWQKRYEEVKGNVYCSIGIKDENTGEWVWKSDCGMESNVDAAKGEASDATKRAAVCWGIGRELYSSPRIKIKCPDNYYNKDDRMTMTFIVKEIEFDEFRNMTKLVLTDRTGKKVYDLTGSIDNSLEPGQDNLQSLKDFCGKAKKEPGISIDELKKFYGYYEGRCGKWADFNPEKSWSKWLATAR